MIIIIITRQQVIFIKDQISTTPSDTYADWGNNINR
jgi:hypothetical protein